MLAKLFIHTDPEILTTRIDQELKKMGIKKNDPDSLWLQSDQKKLSLEDLKLIKDHFYLKAMGDIKSVVVIGAGDLSIESQNSLLKIIEETPGNGLIILGANSEANLLPTILSRVEVSYLTKTKNPQKDDKDVIKFLNLNTAERFVFIESLEEKEDFLDNLTYYYSNQISKDPKLLIQAKAVLEAKQWLASNGNIRAILEFLALNL